MLRHVFIQFVTRFYDRCVGLRPRWKSAGNKDEMKPFHLQSRTVGLDVCGYDVVVQRQNKREAGCQQLVFVLLHFGTHLQKRATAGQRSLFTTHTNRPTHSHLFAKLGEESQTGILHGIRCGSFTVHSLVKHHHVKEKKN